MASDSAMPEVPQPEADDDRLQYVSEEKAIARVNLGIEPDSLEWTTKLREFRELLGSQKTIEQILVENFTAYEAQMAVPSERKALKELQGDNTNRYYTLFGTRFKDVRPSLAVKLTMLHFGLPIEPIVSPLDELMAEIETRDPEGPRYDVEPPLHFLTAHNRRNWGKDSLRGREAVNYPLPVDKPGQPFMTLRGGGDNDSDVGGGEEETASSTPRPSYPIAFDDTVIYLYGYQGCLPVVPRKWKTYAVAVKRLLSLKPGVDVANDFRLVHFEKRLDKVLRTVDDNLPLHSNSPTFTYLKSHFDNKKSVSSHGNCCAFFVLRKEDSNPLHWEPQREQLKTDVAKIGHLTYACENGEVLNPAKGYAYLPFPKAVKGKPFQIADHAANQYDPFFRSAIEVLVGRPEGSFLPTNICLYSKSQERIPDQARVAYGALGQHQDVWNRLHPLNNPGNRWELASFPLAWDKLALVLPNFYPRYASKNWDMVKGVDNKAMDGPTYRFPDAIATIRNMVAASLGGEVDKLDYVRVLPGHLVLSPKVDRDMAGYLVPVRDSVPNMHQTQLDEVLSRFILDKQEPFVLLYPEWENHDSRLYAGWHTTPAESSACVEMPNLKSTFKKFQECVRKLCEITKYPGGYRPDEHYLTIRSKLTTTKPVPIDTDYPRYLVGPGTTEAEWHTIRVQLTSRNAEIQFVDKDKIDWVRGIPKSNVWGPRYNLPASARRKPKVLSFGSDTEITGGNQSKTYPKTPVAAGFSGQDDASARASRNTDAQPPARGNTLGPAIQGPFVDENDRERTYATQPSIYDGLNPHLTGHDPSLRIPINAPPLENILRTSSNVPMVSKAILTPTEQAELQRSFWEVRNIALSRVAPCSYKGCDFHYRLDDEESIEKHLRLKHLASKCMWCDEPMYQWWSEEQKNRHLREKHKEKLLKALGETAAASTKSPQRPRPAQVSRPPAVTPPVAPPTPSSEARTSGQLNVTQKLDQMEQMIRSLQPGTASNGMRNCPFFESCGAAVKEMSLLQFTNHLRANHVDEIWPEASEDLESDSPDPDETESQVGSQEESESEKPGQSQSTGGKGTSDRTGATSATNSSANVSAEAAKTSTQSEQSSAVSSEVSRGRARERTTGKKRSRSKLDNDEASSEEETHRRRGESPDWVAKLGPSIDGYEPDEGMYCSKCLRKAPKHRDRSPGRSPLGRKAELEFHTDPNRCCKIRNAPGSGENLPNRSGWITASDFPMALGKIKAEFLKKYPAYTRTLYPFSGRDKNATLWRSDPNNEANEDAWDLPWPPYEGQPPFPGGWEAPEAEEPQDNAEGRSKRPRRKTNEPKDPEYRYESDEDSADGMDPDVDDLSAKKKRRRPEDPLFRPQDGADSDPEAGRAAKKAKKDKDKQEMPSKPDIPSKRGRSSKRK